MRRNLKALQDTEFDLVVIGGGISGACLAHDAALRGLSVALVEQRDFGAATSAASSKLLHGGVRYLQQAQIHKLRESALERSYFQTIAPHLTHYIPFLIPTYRGALRGRTALQAALTLYELLCRGHKRVIRDPAKRVPRGRHYSRRETLALAPLLDGQAGLTGSHVLYESHMHSSERMTLAFLKTAVRNGATIANYVAVEGLLGDGARVKGVEVRDTLDDARFEIRARVVANAAGPWIPQLNDRFRVKGLYRNITSFSKGAHLVTRQLTDQFALVLPTPLPQQALIDRGGRHVFVIPWRNHSLIGTTNVPFTGSLDEVSATNQDIADFLREINQILPGAKLSRNDVVYAYAGLYPLTDDSIRPDVYQGTGNYQVVDHATLGDIDGLISVLGAKFTTARKVAELATDNVLSRLGRTGHPCRTGVRPLVGGDIADLPAYTTMALARHSAATDAETVRHLVHHYGTELDDVLATRLPGMDPVARLSPDRECVEAEVAYAVKEEMAAQLEDVVFRRTGLGTLGHPGSGCLRRCAEIMARGLGWSPEHTEQQLRHTEALFAGP